MIEIPHTLAIFNDLGGGEMLVVGFVALLLFGKDLPTATRKFGKVYSEIKKGLSDASFEIRREMDHAAQSLDEAAKEAKSAANDVKKEIHSAKNEVSSPTPSSMDSLAGSNGYDDHSAKLGYDSTPPVNTVSTTPLTRVVKAASVSPSAALDSFQRDIVPPTKIPPPV